MGEFKLVSLGYNCYSKKLCKTFVNSETNVFDWLGISLWSINKLIDNNYEGLTDKEDMIIYNYCNKYSVTSKQYFIRFYHDFHINPIKDLDMSTILVSDSFKNKYSRRVERFNGILSSDEPVIFVHIEENNENRPGTMIKHGLTDNLKHYPSVSESESDYHNTQTMLELKQAESFMHKISIDRPAYLIYFSKYVETGQETSDDRIICINYDDPRMKETIFLRALNNNIEYLQSKIQHPNKNK